MSVHSHRSQYDLIIYKDVKLQQPTNNLILRFKWWGKNVTPVNDNYRFVLATEKREFNFFQFDPSENELTVEFQVCVQGDKSEVPCRQVSGHLVQVIDEVDVIVSATIAKGVSLVLQSRS